MTRVHTSLSILLFVISSLNYVQNDYIILMRGVYEEFISEKDNKLHFGLINHNFEYECKGPVAVEVHGPLHSDKAKDLQAKEFVTKNETHIEKILQDTVLPSFMGVIAKGIDLYLREVPTETIMEDVE